MRIASLFFVILFTLLPVFCSCTECEHVWDRGYIAKGASDKEVGYYIYNCTECGEKKTEEIPKLSHIEHDYKDWGGDEEYHWLVCSYDDCSVTTNKHTHTWVDKFGGGLICQVCRKDK